MLEVASSTSDAAVMAINRMRRGLNDLERSVTAVRCREDDPERVDFFIDGVPWCAVVDEHAKRALAEANARSRASLILSLMFEGAARPQQASA